MNPFYILILFVQDVRVKHIILSAVHMTDAYFREQNSFAHVHAVPIASSIHFVLLYF